MGYDAICGYDGYDSPKGYSVVVQNNRLRGYQARCPNYSQDKVYGVAQTCWSRTFKPKRNIIVGS